MQKRAEVHSTESSVVTDEKGRIVIDIPGVDDAEKVLSDLGKEGSLDFVAQDDMDLSSGKPVYTKTICTGKDIKSAEAGTTQDESTKTKKYVVSLKFKSKGTKAFATATEEAAPSHKMIYIVYDGKVISNPGVTEAITNGEAQISLLGNIPEDIQKKLRHIEKVNQRLPLLNFSALEEEERS